MFHGIHPFTWNFTVVLSSERKHKILRTRFNVVLKII